MPPAEPNPTPQRPADTPSDADPFAGHPEPGFFGEFVEFLKTSRKWWMLPLLLIFLLLGSLLILAQTAAAPFIYTLF